jgi:hypothetical protein
MILAAGATACSGEIGSDDADHVSPLGDDVTSDSDPENQEETTLATTEDERTPPSDAVLPPSELLPPSDELLPPEIGAAGQGRDVSGLTLSLTAAERWLYPNGGNGGTYTGHVGTGVIYAMQVNSGDYVDRIQFAYYLPSQPDNYFRNGDFVGNTGRLGGTGGGVNPWVYCPPGQGMVGIRGASGSLVDRIGIVCSDVNYPYPTDPVNFVSPLYGGGGGSWFDSRCYGGELMTAVNVRSGIFIDQIQGICIPAH